MISGRISFEGLEFYPRAEDGTLVVKGLMDSACIDPGVFPEMISEVTIAPIGDGVSLVVACFGQHMVAAMGRKLIRTVSQVQI
jgi:hypothetical protein